MFQPIDSAKSTLHTAAAGKPTVSTQQQRNMPLSSTRIVDTMPSSKKETAIVTQSSNVVKTQNKETVAKPAAKEAAVNVEKKSEKEATASSASSNNNNNNENKTGK